MEEMMSEDLFPLPDSSSVCSGKFSPLRNQLVGIPVSEIAGARWGDVCEMVTPSSRWLLKILHRHLRVQSLETTNFIGNVLNLSWEVTPGTGKEPYARLHMDTLDGA